MSYLEVTSCTIRQPSVAEITSDFAVARTLVSASRFGHGSSACPGERGSPPAFLAVCGGRPVWQAIVPVGGLSGRRPIPRTQFALTCPASCLVVIVQGSLSNLSCIEKAA